MTAFRELPTIVRRSFEAFVQRFQDDHPGANLRRTSEPRVAGPPNTAGYGPAYVIPFEDEPSGAKYEVTVSASGAVFDPVRTS